MSREPELYKDKIEVSLDGRQIFYLFFGGSVIVALVFVLGVMVGRRVEARGHVERAHVEAAVDPLAALDRLEGGAGLSFQGTLRGAQPPATPVEQRIAELAPKPVEKEKKIGRQDAEVAKPEAKAVPKPEPKPEAKADAKVEAKAEKKDSEKKDSEKKDSEKKDSDKKADAPKKSDGDKHAEADKKDGDKKDGEKKDPEKKPKFTLQLSSFQDKAEADAYVQSVKQAGFPAYVTQGDVDGKQFYRVRLGSYRTIDAANDAKAEFEKSAKKSALVTKL